MRGIADWWYSLGEDELRAALLFAWGVCCGVLLCGAMVVVVAVGAS